MKPGLVVANKYRILSMLGSGGMGSVWQAVHTVTEREFAIKFLHASFATNANLLARFFQEAKVSGKIRHPSIIEIFDLGTAQELDGTPFLVMELLDGASLDILVRKLGPLPPRLVLESIAEVANALVLAHDKGIVHRDLKPANIFLHRPGTGALVPKVLDFGISKIATSGTPDVAAAGLTQTGAILGSPLYMSPEQAASDKTIDGRSDVHALGVVLWECLTGTPPFMTDSYNNLVVQIITGERPRLSQAMTGASSGLCAIVERAFARKREDRFPSAGALAAAIEEELARMGGAPSLTSRTAGATLFDRVKLPSSVPLPDEPPHGTTTGGVSVPSVPRPASPSPAAYSVASPDGSFAPSAFVATEQAPSERAAVVTGKTVPEAAAEAPAEPSRGSDGRANGWRVPVLGASVVMIAIGAAAVFGKVGAPPAVPRPVASASTEASPAPPAAPIVDVALAADGGVASSPLAPAIVAPNVNVKPQPHRAGPPSAPKTSHAAPRPADDPNASGF